MSGIELWSATAANNTSNAGINIAENCPAANLNNSDRQIMAAIREWYNDSQWVQYGDGDGAFTIAYASSTSFTVASTDVTAVYEAGRRVKAVAATPGTIYGTISSSSFSTNTTVNVTWDSGSLSNESLTVYIGAISATNSSVPVSSATAKGAVELATTTETLTGTDATRAVTPDGLAALWEKGSDIASATTISIGEGGYFHVTGTTTITDIDFATDKAGRFAWLIFDGALTLTHNSTTLILPTGANITTAAGDACLVVSEDGTDNVRVPIYSRKSGAQLAAQTVIQQVRTQDATATFSTTTQIPEDDTIPQNTEGDEITTLATTITPTNANSIIVVEALVPLSSTAQRLGLALFQGAVADALAVVCRADTGSSATMVDPVPLRLVFRKVAGTTSSITFKLRAGPLSGSAGTVRMNQNSSGARLFGGVSFGYLQITEYAA